MSTKHDLTYIDGHDDEDHDRYIEYAIVYTFTPGYWDSVDAFQEFWVDGEIYVNSVQVRYVEFFEPTSGRTIARVKRVDIESAALTVLDQLALDRVDTDINIGGPLSEQLAENAE